MSLLPNDIAIKTKKRKKERKKNIIENCQTKVAGINKEKETMQIKGKQKLRSTSRLYIVALLT